MIKMKVLNCQGKTLSAHLVLEVRFDSQACNNGLKRVLLSTMQLYQ